MIDAIYLIELNFIWILYGKSFLIGNKYYFHSNFKVTDIFVRKLPNIH